MAGQAYALAAASRGLLAFEAARARPRARAPPTANRRRVAWRPRELAPWRCRLRYRGELALFARPRPRARAPPTANRRRVVWRCSLQAVAPNNLQYIFIMASCQMDYDSAWPRGLAKVLQPEPKTALAGQAYALTAASHDLLRRPCSASAFSSP